MNVTKNAIEWRATSPTIKQANTGHSATTISPEVIQYVSFSCRHSPDQHLPRPPYQTTREHHRYLPVSSRRVYAGAFLPAFSFFPDLSDAFQTNNLVLPKQYPCSAQVPNEALQSIKIHKKAPSPEAGTYKHRLTRRSHNSISSDYRPEDRYGRRHHQGHGHHHRRRHHPGHDAARQSHHRHHYAVPGDGLR